MQDYSQKAINAASHARIAYCKFITPNDAGTTGAHQYGYHIHKDAYSIAFDEPGIRGHNKDAWVTIRWQDNFETSSRFIYYGERTRNEYRLTRFGNDFPFLGDESVGDLLVLCRQTENYYAGYILRSEDEIENFLNYFGISPIEANGILSAITSTPQDAQSLMQDYIKTLAPGFPQSKELSLAARNLYMQLSGENEASVATNPDMAITQWIDTEYSLFQELEKSRYQEPYLNSPFSNVESLVVAANVILNRRKSRAGHSLENHLAKLFDLHDLSYTSQGITEGRKRPDFIMPSIERYHEAGYDSRKLVLLAAKTTCKDRWRQVISEADKIERKHLFTLQQGISSTQLDEMQDAHITLVVPRQHLSTFPVAHRASILTLNDFITYAKEVVN